MLKSDLVETDKHSIIILLRRKNLRFLRRTNHNTNTLQNIAEQNFGEEKFFKIKWKIAKKNKLKRFDFKQIGGIEQQSGNS